MEENYIDKYYPYIDDDCLIEDEVYNAIKDTIKCQYCHQILKNPVMCNICCEAFCNNCVKKMQKDKKNRHKCKRAKYIKNQNIIKTMGKLKYLCKNCKNEIKQEDIENHLKDGCERNVNPSKLMDCIFRKKLLTKLNKEELKKLKDEKKKIHHITSKIFIINNIICFSNIIGKS